VADRAVLAAGVHRLQHDQEAVLALGVEQLLQLLQARVELLDTSLALFFV